MRLLPKTRGGALWRFALASVLVIGLSAGTTAVAGLLQVNNIIVKDINRTPPLKNPRVVLPAAGAPQTLLLIGSDHRAGTSYNSANTDTMMLVRINDKSSTINLLSVPRDLRVQLPIAGGEETAKLNEAYSVGGPDLLIKTMQQQVFPGLQVNHIFDVNFRAFSDMVNAIGCVYTMVDHRYYNNTALTDYSSIDIEPGYQRLCGGLNSGRGALSFVRFRHTDTDIVRNARQQDFIRWAKDQYGTSTLFTERDKLLRIFGDDVQTDGSLHTTDGLLNLFELVLGTDSHDLKSIPFPAAFTPCDPTCYVVPTSTSAEHAAYRHFMTPMASKPKSSGASHHHHQRASTKAPTKGLVADPGDGRSQAGQLRHMRLPIYYPRLILAGSAYCMSITGNCDNPAEPASEYAHSYPHKYLIKDGNTKYPAYVMTLIANAALDEYYNVEGTTWKHPPILSIKPTKTQVYNGLKLYEYYNGGRLSLVAVHIGRAVYWISNTLVDSIPASRMIGMAASLTAAG